MKTLRDFEVNGALYLRDTGIEAQVGDQVKLYLNTEANPGLPEFVVGTIQHPIVRVNCESATSYLIEYNEEDLLGELEYLRPGDVVDSIVVSALEVISDNLDAEIARATAAEEAEESRALAAEALLAPKASPTFTGTVTLPSTTSVGTVSSVEIGYLDGVTSAIQTQLNAKAPSASPSFTGTPQFPATTVALLPAANTVPYARLFVTDATATTFASTVAGGGANIVPVFSNGTNWIIG